MITFQELWEVAAVLVVGSVLQGAVGFAAGLFGVPVLLWLGWTLPETQVIILASTAVQNVWGFVRYRATLEPKEILVPVLLRIPFIPVGIALLAWLHSLPMERVKQVVGMILLLMTVLVALVRPRSQQNLPFFWSVIAFPVSGLMQGFVGMGGPAMVLWVQAHDWSTQRSRAFLFAIYLVSLPFSLTMLFMVFGEEVLRACALTFLLVPVVLLSTAIGLRLGTKLGRKRMRRLTIAILIVLAVSNILAPYLPFA